MPKGLDEHQTELWLLRRRDAKRKLATWSNDACTCKEAAKGHAIWCQIYKCYAYEIGCCDPIMFMEGRYGPFNLPCECIREAFDPRWEEYAYGRFPGTWESRGSKRLGSIFGSPGDLTRVKGKLASPPSPTTAR